MDALAKLKPAFKVEGTVTAGNSSQMSDGAAAVLMTSMSLARERGIRPLARFVGMATAGVAPVSKYSVSGTPTFTPKCCASRGTANARGSGSFMR